jgi:hypothetical protein
MGGPLLPLARLGRLGQAVGYLLDIVERASGNGNDQLVGLVGAALVPPEGE